jgi:hypothetical protein
MNAPEITVEIGFFLPATDSVYFELDDPVLGVLNNTTGTLAGVVFVDVSQWLSGQTNGNRGRSRETDQYSAGTFSFTLRNEDRRFDPSNTASPYWPGIQPRAPINAYLNGVQIFGGYVDDYDVQYEIPNICTVAVSCLDGFCVPANTYLNGFNPPSELTGARVARTLNTIGYPAARNLDTGNTVLAAGSFNNVYALDHLQMAARSENGFLFVDRTGVLTFFDRYQVGSEDSRLTFTDTGPGVGYAAITQKSQSLLLYNQIIGTRTGGTQQTAQSLTSEQQYLPRALLLGELGNNTDTDTLGLCEYLLGRYSKPDVRFDTLSLDLQSLNVVFQQQLALLELVDLVTVMRTPPGVGTPATITKLSIIDGIAWAFDVSNSTYTVALQLGSVDTRSFFKLDDPVFGLLDSGNKLNY